MTKFKKEINLCKRYNTTIYNPLPKYACILQERPKSVHIAYDQKKQKISEIGKYFFNG